MKDWKRNPEHAILWEAGQGPTVDTANLLNRVDVALHFLAKEGSRSLSDKVADDFSFEEMVGLLMHAERYLKEKEEEELG